MNNNNAPKDVFMHLLSMIALYISAGSLITLLFQYINIYFPDALQPVYYSGVAGTIRWAMAALMIIFPIYLAVMNLLNQDYAASPEKKDLKIRKWLVYFTLFAAAIIISTDLVALVYNFLGGELTTRFLLKVLVVATVVGTVFAYYGMALKENLTKNRASLFFTGSVTVVALSVTGGFFTAGSPLNARLYRFDEQRVADLQALQYQVVEYWIQKQALPESLSDLKNDISGFKAPEDPETSLPYEYAVTTTKASAPSFTLCADFNLNSFGDGNVAKVPLTPYYEPYLENWNHSEGRQCFDRTIDPERYQDRLRGMKY